MQRLCSITYDDFPYFAMLLDGMWMVKMGVSDSQQLAQIEGSMKAY